MPLLYKNATDAVHLDKEKRVAYFKPMDPSDLMPPITVNNSLIIGEHYYSNAAIEEVAHEFNKDIRIIGIDHENIAQSSLVENFIARGGYKFPNSNKPINDGSWVVGIKLESDDLWNAAKSGKIKGISPAGQYLDQYYDDNLGKWVVNKLNCKELSLIINKEPKNKAPMLYANAEEEGESMEDPNKTKEPDNKAADPVKAAPEVKSDKVSTIQDDGLNKTLDNLNTNIQANTEAVLRSDPNYEQKMKAQERQNLIEHLTNSKDPAAGQLLTQLQQASDPQIVGEGFDMTNLQTEDAAKAQGVGDKQTFQKTNISPAIQPVPQKQTPDVFIDPEQYLKQQSGKEQKPMPPEMRKELIELNSKYSKNHTLDPRNLIREADQIAKNYNYV